MINFQTKEICFSGFSKDTMLLELSGNVDYLGVRLKPGAFYSIFGIDADVIMDTMTPFVSIETNKIYFNF